MKKKMTKYSFSGLLFKLKIPMEQFLISGLIVLALSNLASSKEKYLMETPDCSSCIWEWNNKAFFRFNHIVSTVCI